MNNSDGYRPNVGIILANAQDQLFWAKRIKQSAWQFPQGGIDEGEDVVEGLFRELWEEVGLKEADVSILGETRNWLRYRIPKQLLRNDRPACIGQKQKWFLLRLKSTVNSIDLTKSKKPEFDDWHWVSYWYPLRKIVSFKREVYRMALRELAPILFGITSRGGRTRPLQNILYG